jgi:hypothetical protein
MKTTNCTIEVKQTLRDITAARFLLGGVFFLIIISVIILSWVPPVSRDALTHHLAVPKLYLAHGSIHEIPSMVVSYYPMNVDLLYLIPLYFGNDIVPKFIHFVFALLTAWLIFSYLTKRLGSVWAIFGSIFFLSLPIIVKLSITVYVDLGLVFFSTAALISLLKWAENQFQVRFLIVSAICCGLALGTKYNGLIVFFVLTVFIPFVFMRKFKTTLSEKNSTDKPALIKIQFKALGFGVLFALIALLVFSPWMIRNYIWKANPIYPLHDHIFNRPKPVSLEPQIDPQMLGLDVDSQPPSDVNSSAWGSFAMRSVIYGESWWEIALIPVRIFFQGQDNNPKHFDGKLSPFLLLLPFFTFFQATRDSATLRIEKKIFIFFAILVVMYTFCTTSIRIRYIAPIIPPLIILSVFGLHNIVSAFTNRWEKLPKWLPKSCIIILGGAIVTYNGLYIIRQFNYVQPFSYLSGQVSRDAYIEKYRPEYAVYQFANRRLPGNSKLLALFLGNRRYYCDREVIFGVKEFQESVNRFDSADILRMELKERGYTHIIIRFDLFNWWAGKQFGDSKNEMLREFFAAYLEPVLSQNGYGLFTLR